MLYQSAKDPGYGIAESLERAGIKLTKVKNLSWMHILFASRSFDAVLISRSFLDRHKVSPSHHVLSSKSSLNLISWAESETGTLEIETLRIRSEGTLKDDEPDTTERLCCIESILRSISIPDKSVHPADNTANGKTPDRVHFKHPLLSAHSGIFSAVPLQSVPKEPLPFALEYEVLLHKKLRSVLNALIQAGNTGADIGSITKTVWGTDILNKKNDIQIYISKLRRIISKAFSDKYRIILTSNRYFLIDTTQLSQKNQKEGFLPPFLQQSRFRPYLPKTDEMRSRTFFRSSGLTI